MKGLLLKLLLGALYKLLSEAAFERALILGLHWVSKQTENQLDDRAVEIVADSLGLAGYLRELKGK